MKKLWKKLCSENRVAEWANNQLQYYKQDFETCYTEVKELKKRIKALEEALEHIIAYQEGMYEDKYSRSKTWAIAKQALANEVSR